MTEWTRRDIDIAICLLADIATGVLELAGYRNTQVMSRAVQYAEEMQKQGEGGYTHDSDYDSKAGETA